MNLSKFLKRKVFENIIICLWYIYYYFWFLYFDDIYWNFGPCTGEDVCWLEWASHLFPLDMYPCQGGGNVAPSLTTNLLFQVYVDCWIGLHFFYVWTLDLKILRIIVNDKSLNLYDLKLACTHNKGTRITHSPFACPAWLILSIIYKYYILTPECTLIVLETCLSLHPYLCTALTSHHFARL